MDKNKKLTLEDLVTRKLQKDNDKFMVKEIFIDSLGGSLLFKKLKNSRILQLIDEIEDNKTSEMYQVSVEMIYESCEMLQNPELHKKCEIVDPLDIVPALISIKEILEIGSQLIEFFGFKEKIEEIKN